MPPSRRNNRRKPDTQQHPTARELQHPLLTNPSSTTITTTTNYDSNDIQKDQWPDPGIHEKAITVRTQRQRQRRSNAQLVRKIQANPELFQDCFPLDSYYDLTVDRAQRDPLDSHLPAVDYENDLVPESQEQLRLRLLQEARDKKQDAKQKAEMKAKQAKYHRDISKINDKKKANRVAKKKKQSDAQQKKAAEKAARKAARKKRRDKGAEDVDTSEDDGDALKHIFDLQDDAPDPLSIEEDCSDTIDYFKRTLEEIPSTLDPTEIPFETLLEATPDEEEAITPFGCSDSAESGNLIDGYPVIWMAVSIAFISLNLTQECYAIFAGFINLFLDALFQSLVQLVHLGNEPDDMFGLLEAAPGRYRLPKSIKTLHGWTRTGLPTSGIKARLVSSHKTCVI